MKITRVHANNHKRAFEIQTRRGEFTFPYAIAKPTPSSKDKVVSAHVDAELGREAFTYELESGREGSVHLESVLEYNKDPKHLADLLLYKLTVEAQHRKDKSSLSTREITRRLNTSASQLYRLLDPTNYRKSLHQMLSLLFVLGYEVDFNVKKRSRTASL